MWEYLSSVLSIFRHFPFSLNLLLMSCSNFHSNDEAARMATAHLLPHLKSISLEPPSCTLITKDGSRLEVLPQSLQEIQSLSFFVTFFRFSPTSSPCSVPSLPPSLHKLDPTQPSRSLALRRFWGLRFFSPSIRSIWNPHVFLSILFSVLFNRESCYL